MPCLAVSARRRLATRSDRRRCWLREIPRCCTIVNARGISIHSALPAWWEEKSAVVWWFVIATVLIINGSSIIPTFAPATTTPDSYAINLCPLPYLLAPRIRFSLAPNPKPALTFDSVFNFLTLPDLFYGGHDKVNFMIQIPSMTPTTRAMNQRHIRSRQEKAKRESRAQGRREKRFIKSYRTIAAPWFYIVTSIKAIIYGKKCYMLDVLKYLHSCLCLSWQRSKSFQSDCVVCGGSVTWQKKCRKNIPGKTIIIYYTRDSCLTWIRWFISWACAGLDSSVLSQFASIFLPGFAAGVHSAAPWSRPWSQQFHFSSILLCPPANLLSNTKVSSRSAPKLEFFNRKDGFL